MQETKYFEYLMRNDSGQSLMEAVDADLKTDPTTQTFFAGRYWKLKNGRWYKFLTNEKNKKLEHVGTILIHLGCDHIVKFHKKAVDCMGNPLPDDFSIWVPVDEDMRDTINTIFELYCDLSSRYKELLLQCGIPAEELKDCTDIYLNCEKYRWPDKPWISDRILQLIEDAKK